MLNDQEQEQLFRKFYQVLKANPQIGTNELGKLCGISRYAAKRWKQRFSQHIGNYMVLSEDLFVAAAKNVFGVPPGSAASHDGVAATGVV